jgi:single-strand DNA-binding protein
MAISVNRAILVGNLGKDPERKSGGSGDGFVVFSVATSRSWKNRSGDREEKTEWHNVVLFDKVSADFAEKYLHKGDKVYIEGCIETRKYEKDGRDIYTTEIVVRPFDGRIQAQSKDGGGSRRDEREDDRGFGGGSSRSSGNFGRDLDDEIPF